MNCPHCRHPAAEGDRFCGECGQPLQSPQSPAAASPQPARRGCFRRLLFNLASLLLVALCGISSATLYRFATSETWSIARLREMLPLPEESAVSGNSSPSTPTEASPQPTVVDAAASGVTPPAAAPAVSELEVQDTAVEASVDTSASDFNTDNWAVYDNPMSGMRFRYPPWLELEEFGERAANHLDFGVVLSHLGTGEEEPPALYLFAMPMGGDNFHLWNPADSMAELVDGLLDSNETIISDVEEPFLLDGRPGVQRRLAVTSAGENYQINIMAANIDNDRIITAVIFEKEGVTFPIEEFLASLELSLPSQGDYYAPMQTVFPTSAQANEIRARGAIRVGIHENDFRPFTAFHNGQPVGFEIDLARQLVRRLFGEAVAIEWIPVDAASRFNLLRTGEVDLLLRTTTVTTSRMELAAASYPYFVDGMWLLTSDQYWDVQFEDLVGEPVGVMGGTIYQVWLSYIDDDPARAVEMVVYSSAGDACAALGRGAIAALLGHLSQIVDCQANFPPYSHLAHGPFLEQISTPYGQLGREPYAIFLPLDDPEFNREVNQALQSVVDDGVWDKLYERWFPWAETVDPYRVLNEQPVDH